MNSCTPCSPLFLPTMCARACARVSPPPFFNFLIKSDLALLSRVRGSIPGNESFILHRGLRRFVRSDVNSETSSSSLIAAFKQINGVNEWT